MARTNKNGKNTRKLPINELIYGLLCVVISSSFIAVPIILLSVAGAIDFKIKNGVLLVIFLLLCSIIAGFLLVYRRANKRQTDAKSIADACKNLVEGHYDISFEELSGEYKKIGTALITVSKRLAEAEKEKDDFINDFSHELKTPIVSIRGFAKLIAKGNLTEEEKREYLEIIVSESDRLIDLTASTLMLDRLTENKGTVDKDYFDLSEHLRKCILLLQDEWEAKNIEFVADFEDYTVFSNPELTSQMFLNILQNAVKFSKENSQIIVDVYLKRKELCVKIQDFGEGMDEETQRRMFDKYFRGDKSRSSPGNGLGLATVKQIADALGIELSVTSAPNKGTTFTVTFKNV